MKKSYKISYNEMKLKLVVINDIKKFQEMTMSIKYQMKIYKKSYISKLF